MLPKSFPDRNVCVLGLGYVGLTLAVAMADAGFQVHGVEVRGEVLDKLARGIPHFHEPGLTEKLRHVVARDRFSFGRTPEGCERCSVFIITVGTPLGADGQVRTDMIEAATRQVADCIHDGDLVILRSTVKLGTTRNIVAPILRATGKRFDIAFCPERTLEGQALIELNQLPQIIGAESVEVAARAAQIFGMLTPTTVKVSTLETAEMIKLVDNTYRDVTFAFANEIARLCNAMEVSALEVSRAGKLGYPRTQLPLPGPVGGPCLEKDPHILIESARQFGVDMDITAAGRRINESQPIEVSVFLEQLTGSMQGFPKAPTISLMGLAFKGRPATDDLRGTMAKPLYDELRTRFPNARWRGFDAVVAPDDIRGFGLEPAGSMAEAVDGANLAVILNNHPVFTSMPLPDLASRMDRPGVIYDFWNNFNSREVDLPEGTAYVALGSHGAARFAHVA
ncbi:nucleotide sugar dehydrogenase [Azospirillum rugosum]|uniref:UDP-N-acetyl-D-mannosaminuronic acid dehydrogenase n=1 Tax=Azospirillum rugosum TaxID=416170 RepID=A0ABS4SIA7_9PROT|nr:nucleotide sugar dehydrogenase [Azospirillum rugosum]MBP2292296.1 UDP-N-acetyl-D-mannosaminuronic acid dehydrogenase [Azospirillum rugosum]MDQ0526055.1 UDP-N-acetyl-D-mannosaminuronic acid dehydrogenase [Azospirillum rugosum]